MRPVKRFKQMYVRLLMTGMVVGLFGCSFEGSQYSPEQVINNALEETVEIGAYYAESETVDSEKGEEIERSYMKEWRSDDGKIRVEGGAEEDGEEVIAVNDGETLILYEVDRGQASIIDDPEVLNLNMPSPKEQAHQLLKVVEDTHEVSIEDEEKVTGRETYKLVAKVKEENALIGDLELWVDKENWMVLKIVVKLGDIESETVYTKIDFKPELTADLFSLDLPEGVEVQNLDDLLETTEISLDEVAASIGKPYFYFPEVNGVEISTIELNELRGEIVRNEVNMEYLKNDSPLFTFSVFETPEVSDDDLEIDIQGEIPVDVRGREGLKMDSGDFRFLSWSEEDVNYSIILHDIDLTFEALLEMTDKMERME